ncbi:hypothetical protein JZ751_024524, partial [Albula glossodonta]
MILQPYKGLDLNQDKRQYHLNTTSDMHMDMFNPPSFPEVDFSSLSLPRNGDFTQ